MMTHIALDKRPENASIKELRDSGHIPTIVYGPHFQPSREMSISRGALRKILDHSREIFEVTLDSKKYFVKVSELQTDPVSHKPIHLSLCELPKGSKIELRVPIQIQGDPSAMNPGATILMIRDSIMLKGDMKELPESITIDVSKLVPGENIKVRDVVYKGKAKIVDSSDEVLLVCQHPHVGQTTEASPSTDLLSEASLEDSLR